MTDKQKQWTESKIKQIKKQIEANWPLSDEQWDKVRDTLGEIFEQSKQNAEVRKMLFDAMWEYNQREINERKAG